MTIVNPSTYSFTPPTPGPDSGYLVQLVLASDHSQVMASETVPSAGPNSFAGLRDYVITHGGQANAHHLAVYAVSGSVKSVVTIDTDDTLYFHDTPGPVTNIVITP